MVLAGGYTFCKQAQRTAVREHDIERCCPCRAFRRVAHDVLLHQVKRRVPVRMCIVQLPRHLKHHLVFIEVLSTACT